MIDIEGLNKRFGGLVALDDLALHIGAGETFGFIGPNGAGKSTTMKILAGLLKPDSGTASVCGIDAVHDPAAIKMLLGYMPDFLGVYDDLTVDEYLQFFAAAYRIPRRAGQRRRVVEQVLQLTDLTAKQHAMVDSLSRGMQQRLGVARVLIHEPKVLLLDEPASGLDPRARIELRELLIELRRMGKTIMVSSHILTELAEMCTSIGIIERGRLLFAGAIDEAYARAGVGGRIEVTLEPLGTPEATGALQRTIADALEADTQRVARAEVRDGAIMIDLKPAPEGQPAHAHHHLIECIITKGGRIAAFTPQAVKLEDAFLRLTKGALN